VYCDSSHYLLVATFIDKIDPWSASGNPVLWKIPVHKFPMLRQKITLGHCGTKQLPEQIWHVFLPVGSAKECNSSTHITLHVQDFLQVVLILTPLSAKVEAKIRRPMVVTQSVQFACGLKAMEDSDTSGML
jgi:hypothetical protein